MQTARDLSLITRFYPMKCCYLFLEVVRRLSHLTSKMESQCWEWGLHPGHIQGFISSPSPVVGRSRTIQVRFPLFLLQSSVEGSLLERPSAVEARRAANSAAVSQGF